MFRLDDSHIGLYVADVSGHGVAASLLSVMVSRVMTPEPWPSSLLSKSVRRNRLPFANSAPEVASPADVANQLNDRFPMTDHYFTIVYAVLNTETRELRYVSSAHPPILRVDAAGNASLLDCGDFAIGWMPDHKFKEYSVQLDPGDRVYLYSDGIPEAMTRDSECYGNERMIRSVANTRDCSLEDAVSGLMADVESWCQAGGPMDDVSVLAMDVA